MPEELRRGQEKDSKTTGSRTTERRSLISSLPLLFAPKKDKQCHTLNEYVIPFFQGWATHQESSNNSSKC